MTSSILYLLLYLASGTALARLVVADDGWPAVICLGCGFGIAQLAAFPGLFALAFGFNATAALLGGAAAALSGAAAIWVGRGRMVNPYSKKEWFSFVGCVVPFMVLSLYLLHTHILCPRDGGLWTGQSCYGDLAMHLAFIKSIAVQGQFPPHYSLLAGQSLFGYPFLCESVSSVFLLLGAGLRAAYILPEIPAFVAVYGCFWLLARRALGCARKAAMAFWLFFCGSGFGFLYFCGSAERFKSIFTGYYTTPTNYVEKNIRWVNPVADLLIPQRATLFGWCLLLGCLYLLWRFAFEGEHRYWLPLALLDGCLPLTHTHSFLALVLLCAVYFIYSILEYLKSKGLFTRDILPWLLLAALAGVLACPQLFGIIFRQTGTGEHFLRFHFNWANDGDNYFWFYIKNIGLVYLLLIPAFLHARPKLRRFYGGGLLILLLAECVVFQPNTYDNNKLLFVWHMLGCILAADLLGDLSAALPRPGLRMAAVSAALFLGTFGSVLTLGREAISHYRLFSPGEVAVGTFIDENAAADALFCTGTHHLNAAATLAGRDILCGSSLYVYFHGMHYRAQEEAAAALYESPSEELLREWGVDYIVFSSWEYNQYAVDEAFYATRYPLWYCMDGYTIYKIT